MHNLPHQLEYYRRELSYLRTEAANFATRHPKVAASLVLGDAHSADPHIQHLIESVAFVTAGIHRDIDGIAPALASAILDNLCLTLAHPVAAMTVMHMTLDSENGKVTAGSRVPHGALLSTSDAAGPACRFRTCWDATLWPLRVSAVGLQEARVLRIDCKADDGVDLADLELDILRLHLAGEPLTMMPFHELLLASLDHIEVAASTGVHRLPLDCMQQACFAEHESMLSNPSHAQPAYGLLQEYFAFPRKLQFFDLHGLRGKLGQGTTFSIRLVFSHAASVLTMLRSEHVRLNCVPAINLFPVTSEPFTWDGRHYENLLVPHRKRDAATEVHSVLSVTVSDPRADRSETIPSVFADSGGAGGTDSVRGNAPLCWTMRREASLRPGISGTDVYLGFVDRRDPATTPADTVVYAKLLCTNRELASQITPGTRFYGEGMAASTVVRALYQPSPQRAPPLDSAALWALVSLLRLNHRSLVDGSSGVKTLREMLGLFASDSARDAVQIGGIKRLTATPGTARMGGQSGEGAWRGHCRGTDIVIEFDLAAFTGSSALLLASVLARFFALYTSANSFVRLTVERDGETWMEFPPMTGRQALI